VDENEAVDSILQIVCREEIAMGITYKVAKEPDAHKDCDESESSAEVYAGGDILRAGVFTPLFCMWDAQVRRHFQDCHHRHDERSNGAKTKNSA